MLKSAAIRGTLRQGINKGAQTSSSRNLFRTRRCAAKEEQSPKASSSKDEHSKLEREKESAYFPIAPSVEKGQSHRTQYNVDPFSLLPTEEHSTFPLVTAATLGKNSSRPRKVRMLARDFIHDSLYNPHYGYFSRHAVLLPDGIKQERSYDFSNLKSERDFMAAVEERYSEFEESLEDKEDYKRSNVQLKSTSYPFTREGLEEAQRRGKLDAARQAQSEKEAGEHDRNVKSMAARQVWHTPTELFKPHYAQAIARYMIESHEKRDHEKPLHIYEVGAGSGALAHDILDYLAKHHFDVYRNMMYTIIEISPRLAKQQADLLKLHIRARKANIVNESILEYKQTETDPCFFIALEVLDNLAHDVVRYSTDTLQPYQAIVSIDETGDIHELWEPAQDEKILRYLSLVQAQNKAKSLPVGPFYLSWLPQPIRSTMVNHFPFYPNLTPPYFIPTGSLQLLNVLAANFPNHHAIISDFDTLPDSLVGLNAPVVQTRLEGSMIPVTTYTVQQGFFDIFFPTNFKLLQQVHANVTNCEKKATVMDHQSFLKQYAQLDKTTCKDGSNPMLSWYANASWFLS